MRLNKSKRLNHLNSLIIYLLHDTNKSTEILQFYEINISSNSNVMGLNQVLMARW